MDDRANSVAVTADGAVVTGRYEAMATFGTTQVSGSRRHASLFLAKYKEGSGEFAWVTTSATVECQRSDEERPLPCSNGLAVAVNPVDDSICLGGYFAGKLRLAPGVPPVHSTRPDVVDGFVSKLDRDGRLLWFQALRGTGNQETRAIGANLDGGCTAAGTFRGEMRYWDGANRVTSPHGWHDSLFLAKYDAVGGGEWIVTAGGPHADIEARGLAFGPAGDVVLTGRSWGPNVTFGSRGIPGPTNAISSTERSAFLARYSGDGDLRWALRVGDEATRSGGKSVAMDLAGNAYVTGYVNSTGRKIRFGSIAGASRPHDPVGWDDAFVAKYRPNGRLAWAKLLGSTAGDDTGWGVAVDALGSVLVTGGLEGDVRFSGKEHTNLGGPGNSDVFLARYDVRGRPQTLRVDGSRGREEAGRALAISPLAGRIYVAGTLAGGGSLTPVQWGESDAFLASFPAEPP